MILMSKADHAFFAIHFPFLGLTTRRTPEP
jgi:hypothetical protein